MKMQRNQAVGTDLAKSSGASPPSLEEVEMRIVALLFSRAMPATERDIQRGVRVRRSILVTALRRLHKKRRVRRLGLGRNRCEYWYFVCGSCLLRAKKSKRSKWGKS